MSMSTPTKILALGALAGGAWLLFRKGDGGGAAALSSAGGAKAPPVGSANTTVLSVARAIPDGGVYKIDGSGVPVDIVHKGAVILAKGNTVYCSGFTFATAMEAARRRGLLDDKSIAQVKKFQQEWYGGAAERQRGVPVTSLQLSGPALESIGIGKIVPASDARPGDFVQYWRNTRSPSGHSVVFLDWLTDDKGQRIGLKYRSAGLSKGVADSSEKFAGHGGTIDPNRTFFSRLFDAPTAPRVA